MRRPPKGWTRATFLARSKREPGTTETPGFIHPDAPGLIVNESAFAWVVSHRRSGMFINPGFPDAETACRFALAISPQGDFRRSAREILADEALKGGVVIVRQRPEFLKDAQTFERTENPADEALDA